VFHFRHYDLISYLEFSWSQGFRWVFGKTLPLGFRVVQYPPWLDKEEDPLRIFTGASSCGLSSV